MPESPYPMIPVTNALNIILGQVQPLPPLTLPFDQTLGLVLAEDVISAEDMPPFPASAMDGYAVIADDDGPRQIVGDQMAGYMADLTLTPGTAARITTGAPVPSGADAVVVVENTLEEDSQLTLTAPVQAGDNIRPVGVDIATGQQVLAAGTVLNPAEIGLLATVGLTEVKVYPRPKVAVMSTGDEILKPDQKLQPGQIRDANRFTLMNVVRQNGATPYDLGIVRDQEANLETTIQRGLSEAHALLTSGGVSMGQLDLVKPYLAEHGTLHFGRVKIKPGKPITFATLADKPFFAMPGNPVSALVCFELFVRPALLKMAGHRHWQRPRHSVILSHPISHNPHLPEYQRAIITRQPDGQLIASTTGSQSSGRLLSMRGANGLLILPEGQGDYAKGSVVEALLVETVV